MIVLTAVLLPNSFNNNVETEDDMITAQEDEQQALLGDSDSNRSTGRRRKFSKNDFTFGKILGTSKRIQFAYLCMFVGCFSVNYSMPFLSIHMHDVFGVPDEMVGFVFMIVTICYTISALLTGLCLRGAPRRMLYAVAFALCAASCIFASHWRVLGFPQKMWTICVAMVLLGLAQGPLAVMVLPEAHHVYCLTKGYVMGLDHKLDAKLND